MAPVSTQEGVLPVIAPAYFLGRFCKADRMAVEETYRAIVEHKPNYQGTFITMQTAHAEFDLGSFDTMDLAAESRLNKYAGEEADEIGCVQQRISVLGRHIFVKTPREVVSPGAVLVAQVLFFGRIVLFLFLEEAFCTKVRYNWRLQAAERLTSRDLFVFQIDKLLKSKDKYIRRLGR